MSRDLLFLALSLFTWGIGEGLFLYFQPLYLQQLGASPVVIGSILGGMGVAMALTQIPAGYLGDRIGRRPLIWASWIIGTTATVMMALSPNLTTFTIALIIYGGTGFATPPMNSYITNTRGKWSVGQAITFISAVYNMGAIAGPYIGGKIADSIGLRQVYVIAAGFFIIATILVFFIRPQPVELLPEGHNGRQLFHNSRFMGFIGLFFIVVLATYLPQPLTANFLQNDRGLSFGEIGILGSLASLGIVILSLSLGRMKAQNGFVLAQGAAFIFSMVIWRGTGLAWYMVGYLFYGGMRVAKNLGIALTKPLVHPAQLGTAFGFMETACSIALIAAPPLAGLIYQYSPQLVYPLAAVMVTITMVISLRKVPSENVPLNETVLSHDRGLE